MAATLVTRSRNVTTTIPCFSATSGQRSFKSSSKCVPGTTRITVSCSASDCTASRVVAESDFRSIPGVSTSLRSPQRYELQASVVPLRFDTSGRSPVRDATSCDFPTLSLPITTIREAIGDEEACTAKALLCMVASLRVWFRWRRDDAVQHR